VNVVYNAGGCVIYKYKQNKTTKEQKMKNFKVYYKVNDEMFTIDVKDTSAEVVKQTLDSTLCTWFKGVTIVKVEEIA